MYERLAPPMGARKKLLLKLHDSNSHKGMVWETAKAIWFWPGICNGIQQSNRSCGKCIKFSRLKLQQNSILPIELCKYSPGEYLNMDLFQIGTKDYLTTIDKLSGLILGEQLQNISLDKTCCKVEALFMMISN